MLNYTITIAISAFFVPHYLGGLFWEPLRHAPGGHHLRHRRRSSCCALVNVVGVKESAGVNVLLAVVDFLTQLLLVLVGAGARLLARDAGRQRRPRRRADVEGLPPRDPDRDDRLHRDRDDLEHGRGGQGRDEDDPGGDQPRASSPSSRSTPRCRRSRCRALPVTQNADGEYVDAARPARGPGRLRRRPDPRRRQADRPRARCRSRPRSTSACSPRRSSSSPPTPGSSASRGSSTRWACTARCPTGCASCTRSYGTPWIGILLFGGDRLPGDDPRPGRVPGQHVRLRRDAVVHDRAPRGHPRCATRYPDCERPYRGPGNAARSRGRRLPAVRRVRRHRHRAGVRRRHGPAPRRRASPASAGWRSAASSTPSTAAARGST